MQGARTGLIRELGLALVALALVLRILIAPGFMAMPTERGIRVSLCTGQGPVSVQVPVKQAPGHATHDPCPYAALAAPPLLPDIAVAPVLLPLLAAEAAVTRPAEARPHIGASAPPPPPTGPPAIL